jgi:3-phenylpropionate/trans-cinnamate dioxygenase ferredoxin subunit
MHTACPLNQLAPGDARRLDTKPPIAVLHTEDGEAPNLPPGLTIDGHA